MNKFWDFVEALILVVMLFGMLAIGWIVTPMQEDGKMDVYEFQYGNATKEETDAAFEKATELCSRAKLITDLMEEVEWYTTPKCENQVEWKKIN